MTRVTCENAIADQFGNEDYINHALIKKNKTVNLLQPPTAERDITVTEASILAIDTYLNQLEALSRKANIDLPKGTSTIVKEVAKSIIVSCGSDEIDKDV